MEQFGVNFFHGGSVPASVSTQQFSSGTTTSAGVGSALSVGDPLNLFLYSASQNIGATIKDLEQKQILQVLAEPTLTTLSGQPARFLSGGEFPFPVVQGGVGTAAAVTIMFRPFGVKVDFTPIVTPDGAIRLKVNPEVSTLDFSNAVTISGFTVPALSTRRAETEVELRNGQSFVVSGILDHRTTQNLSSIPGIASIPILGQLFRSKQLQRSVVELVVIVTATVVDPLSSREPAVEPKMAVPNMQRGAFDAQLSGSKKNAITTSPQH
jgi:pilus assembly protein CpaC